MELDGMVTPELKKMLTPNMRDLLQIGFRYRRLILIPFSTIFLVAVLYAFLKQEQYQSTMQILVKRERVDPLVTAESNSTPKISSISEEEMNSEVYLITSQDLQDKVAWAAFPPPKNDSWSKRLTKAIFPPPPKVPGSPPEMPGKLDVEALKKTNIIEVTFTSPNPQYSARVLNKLKDLYLEKHLAVHGSSGAFDFFKQETDRYRKGLALIESRLSDPTNSQGVVSSQLEKELTLKALPEAEGRLRTAQESISETEQRIKVLEEQIKTTSPRLTTNIRTSDNRSVVQSLKQNLLTLELKRTELLEKYDPSYRAVQEVEKQIAQIRAAMAEEDKVLLKEETSDTNSVYQMLLQELVKAKSQLAGLRASAVTAAENVRSYREKARQLDETEMVQHDLARSQKLAEENYQLYLRKQEEVRISDELDRQRIVNVSIVENATVPTQPYGPGRSIVVLAGGLLGSLASLALAFGANYLNPSFRTPDELERFLKIPVLAAIPLNNR
jgi:uncharacterized protein involved in exopolysaccharide biosynthesis